MYGKMEYNKYCYSLQDTVSKLLKVQSQNNQNFILVPSDSVEDVLASLNLDPGNPQYLSDLWKAVSLLKIKKVVMGNFDFKNGNLIVNGYIYDAKMKLADPTNQVKDLFKPENQVLETANDIVNAILPALIKK